MGAASGRRPLFRLPATSVSRLARGLAVAIVATIVLGGAAGADGITGAGATFPAPVYTRWAEQFAAASGVQLNYQAVGSGAGLTQIINRTVDFGASDAAIAPARLAKENLLQFPAVVGGVVLAVNIPGIDGSKLRLSGEVVADIYLGRIRLWSDKRIAALNPGLKLPTVAVAPTYRADSSGTTNIVSSYLASVSPTFRTVVGVGNSVAWRAGLGAPGNAGVAGSIANIRGAIGYLEYAYAAENRMQTPLLLNASGRYVAPAPAAFAASAAKADWAHAPDLATSMVNTAGEANWPIVGPSYILIPRNPADPARAAKVLGFFDWVFTNGQPAADRLHYVMLPEAVRDLVRARWSEVRSNGKPVYAPAK